MHSDHLTVLRFKDSPRAIRLRDRLAASGDPQIGTTIINAEEAMKGWMASIAKEKEFKRQTSASRELCEIFGFFAGYHIALFSELAADLLVGNRKSGVKTGTMDLKTACIAIEYEALLLTANRRDFEKVPGLRFENWLE